MASEASELSRTRDEAAEREVARQRPWVALASIPLVYGAKHAEAGAMAPGVADLLLELQDPPSASYLKLPERLAPDPGTRPGPPYNFPYIIAAAPARLLVMATQNARGRSNLDPDYFLCDVRAGTATRLPAVPSELPVKLSPRRTMGLIADPRRPGHYMIAQLIPEHGMNMRRHGTLLCFFTSTGQWTVKQLASAPNHEPWGAHGVFAHDGLLWWVDIAYGMLNCDPFDDHPHLRLVSLPPGSQMQNRRNTIQMDQRRFVRPSQGKLRYVEIRGLPYDHFAVNEPPGDPAVSMWTLVDPKAPHPWRFEYEVSFADIWADDAYIAAGLPQDKVPRLALVDPNNHGVIYFFQDSSLFAFDMRAGRLAACEEYFVDLEFKDLDLQYSRFVEAWEWELPPSAPGDDPPSPDGGSGTKVPEGEEGLDAATGSDKELECLLSQMEIKSQPDREQSLSELLSTFAGEDMAPPSEPSPQAEAADQADEP